MTKEAPGRAFSNSSQDGTTRREKTEKANSGKGFRGSGRKAVAPESGSRRA